MHKSIRASAAVLATGLLLIACGTASDTDSGAAPATDVAAAPVTEPAPEPAESTPAPPSTPESEPNIDDGTAEAGTAEAGTADDAATAPVESDPPPAAEEPAASEAAEAVLGGRAFASELAADSDFAENLLPDLLVDDIRSGQKVNIRNVFPAERPVLMWMWAPH